MPDENVSKHLLLISLKGFECAFLPGSKQQREKVRFYLERRSDGREVPISSKVLLLIQALFGYVYENGDPRNQTSFQISLSAFGAYAGICMDQQQRLAFASRYGEMMEILWVESSEDGVRSGQLFTKLELSVDGKNLLLDTTYFSMILREVFARVNANRQQQIFTLWRMPLVRSSICGARDANAALAVLILSVLIAQRGTKEKTAEISLRELVERIPELDHWVRDPERSSKLRNRKLRRWLDRFTEQLGAGNYFEQYTALMERYGDYKISRYFGTDGKAKDPSLSQMVSTHSKILISHGAYISDRKKGLPDAKAPDYSGRGYIPKAAYDRLPDRQQIGSLKYFLKMYLERFGVNVTESRNFCCVLPSHEDHRPSMHYYQLGEAKPYPTVHCFGCGFDGDLFTLIEAVYGIDFIQARQMAEKLFVYDDSNRKGENKNGI